MSEQSSESTGQDAEGSDDSSQDETFEGSDDPTVISDDQLPEDLRPTDDNPLAKPASEEDRDRGMSLGGEGAQL